MSDMLTAFFSWWYGAGWRRQTMLVSRQLSGLSDSFSFALLLKTLFSPFRQISAGRVEGPLGVQLHAVLDKLISRMIGSMVRSTMIFVGLLVMALVALVGGIRIVLWPLWLLVPVLVTLLWAAGALSWT